MTNKYCDSPIHKCLCLSLALIFFFTIVLSIPASADADPSPSPAPSPFRPNEPIGWKEGDTFRDIMLVVLDGWGISFSKSDSSDEKSILEYSDELMEQFYEANQTSQDLFWDMVKYGASETGDIILDFLGVNKIRQFANWLKEKFSLTDNSSVALTPGPFLPYSPSLSYLVSNWSSYPVVGVSRSLGRSHMASSVPGAAIQCCYLSSNTFLLFASSVPCTLYYCYENSGYGSGSVSISTYNDTYGIYVSSFAHPFTDWTQELNEYTIVCSSVEDCYSQASDILSSSSSPGSLIINTRTIEIPSEDLDPDDGLQIDIPGTNWGDSIYTILNIIERLIGLYDSTQLNINTVIELISTLLQGLQQSVAVENIPGAVVLDYDDYDIPLETEWSLVDGFFSEETEGSPFSTLTTILYGLPEPFILFFSVIVVFVVAYGFIRLGRDSH